MKYIIGFSTFLLCVVTLSSTVLFWSSLPADTFGKVLAGITASALEACKYSFFPAGVYYLKKRNPGGLALILIGVLLLMISVAATTGFLENAYNQQTKHEHQSSIEYQTKKEQLNSIQQQIKTLNSLTEADASAQYRTRALETSKRVKNLEAQRDAALNELKNFKDSPQGNAQTLFSVLAIPLGASQESVRQAAFMGLAAIVDICAIAALLALSGIGKKEDNITVENPQETPAETNQKQKPQPQPQPQPQKTIDKKHDDKTLKTKEQKIADEILAGIYGEKLSVRGIISAAKTTHPTVKKVIDYLIDKNQVKREGNQYFLIQKNLV